MVLVRGLAPHRGLGPGPLLGVCDQQHLQGLCLHISVSPFQNEPHSFLPTSAKRQSHGLLAPRLFRADAKKHNSEAREHTHAQCSRPALRGTSSHDQPAPNDQAAVLLMSLSPLWDIHLSSWPSGYSPPDTPQADHCVSRPGLHSHHPPVTLGSHLFLSSSCWVPSASRCPSETPPLQPPPECYQYHQTRIAQAGRAWDHLLPPIITHKEMVTR